MSNSTICTEAMKWTVIVLLAAMLIGVSAVAYWLPVKAYTVACAKSEIVSCRLLRETSGDNQTSQVLLGAHPTATVKVQPRRRGASRVFLYLNSGSENFFAAEFEDDAAQAQAEAAAVELNRVFSSTAPASTSIVVRAPAYFNWMIWGGIGFLSLLVLVIYRELFRPEPPPNK